MPLIAPRCAVTPFYPGVLAYGLWDWSMEKRPPELPNRGRKPMSSSIDQLIDENEVAAILGISVRTVQGRRNAKRAPAYVKIGRNVRYRRADLDAMVDAARVAPQGEAEVR